MNKSRISIRNIFRAALFVPLFLHLCPAGIAAYTVAPLQRQVIDQPIEFSKCWDYKTAPDLSVSPVSDTENAYFVDVDRRLAAVDLKSGNRVWASELGGSVASNLLITNDAIVVATNVSDAPGTGSSKTILRSVSKHTGITGWSVEMRPFESVSLGAINGSVVVVASSGSISTFSTSKGEAVWNKELGARVTTRPHFTSHSVILGTDRREVVKVDAPGGETSVVIKTKGVPTSVYSDTSGRVLAGDDRGNLTLASQDGKRIWRFRNGARISAVTNYDSEFLATSHDNFLYKISRGGNVEWKRRLSGRIGSGPMVADNAGLVATIGDGAVYVIDLTNGKILNRMETGEDSSARVSAGGNGFVILGEAGVMFFSRGGCAANKKTMP